VIVSLSVILIYARCIGMLVVCYKFLNLPTCINFSTWYQSFPERSHFYRVIRFVKETTIFQFLKEVKNKDKMMSSTKLDEKLEGLDNFRAWKYRISLVLEENDLSYYVMEEVVEPEEE
jgi:hypothetical protein